jgi:hypothetical protein
MPNARNTASPSDVKADVQADVQAGFQAFQFEFARHIRNPKVHPRPAGVSAQRMGVYNELLYNNLEGFLLTCFPVLRQLLGKRKWGRLVRDFFAEHRCHTPFFRQIPDEFIQYLRSERGVRENDAPYLQELAHYEWIELVLAVSNKETPLAQIDADGDLAQGHPALNPVLALLEYRYPVHRIGPKFKPLTPPPQPTYLLVFRNQEFLVEFIALNPVTARLVDLLQHSALGSEQLLQQIAQELQHPEPQVVVQSGLATLRELQAAGAILGTWRQ